MILQRADENTICAALLCTGLGCEKETGHLTAKGFNNLIRILYMSKIYEPSQLVYMSESDIYGLKGISEETAECVYNLTRHFEQAANKAEQLYTSGIAIIGIDSSRYSEKFLRCLPYSAPGVFYVYGNDTLLLKDMISVTGLRHPSEKGAEFAKKCGKNIAEKGFCLVSGGAIGCDSIAHTSCIKYGGNAVVFPAVPLFNALQNSEIVRLCDGGKMCLVSDLNPEAAFSKSAILRRNKYIYISAKLSFVCESGISKGGTFRGALECLEKQYTPVFIGDGDGLFAEPTLLKNGAEKCEMSAIDDVICAKFDV